MVQYTQGETWRTMGRSSRTSCYLTSRRVIIQYFVQQVHWNGNSWKVKEEVIYPFTSARRSLPLHFFFSHFCFCQSAQYLRSSCRSMWRIWCEEYGESLFCSDKVYEITKQTGSLRSADLLNVHRLLDRWESTRRPVVHPQRKSAESLEWRAMDKVECRCRICQSSWPWTILHDEGYWWILWNWWSCGLSRMHTSSKRRIINSKRMDSWKQKFVLYWKLRPNTTKESWGLRSEFIFYLEMDLIRGSEFRTVSTNSRETWRKRHELVILTTRMIQEEQGDLLSKKRASCNILGLRQTNL